MVYIEKAEKERTTLSQEDIDYIERAINEGEASDEIARRMDLSPKTITDVKRNLNRRLARLGQPITKTVKNEESNELKMLREGLVRMQLQIELDMVRSQAELMRKKQEIELEKAQLELEERKRKLYEPEEEEPIDIEELTENPESAFMGFLMKLYEQYNRDKATTPAPASGSPPLAPNPAPFSNTVTAHTITPDWAQDQNDETIRKAIMEQTTPEQRAMFKAFPKAVIVKGLKQNFPNITENNINKAYQILHST